MMKIIECKDCGMEFEYTDQQQKKYQLLGYKAPVRCKACRAKRREERASPYWGIKEAFYQPLPVHKGCGRQYYLRHM